MDRLNPADMPAVLERTVLRPSVENFLLPMYESLSNSIYSINERWKTKAVTHGRMRLEITTASFSAKVIDNGIGLNDENYDKFKTPFTNHRLKKTGKGFGRFIGFKVFDRISYSSNYMKNEKTLFRNFDFNIYEDQEIGPQSLSLKHKPDLGCTVYYEGVKASFENISQELDELDIVERVIRYFLPYFIGGQVPNLKISIDGVEFDAQSNFLEFFDPQIQKEVEIDIEGETHKFDIQISKVMRGKLFKKHSMLLFADGRIIGSGRDIEGKIGKAFFEGADGKKHIYIATVSGDFLDKNANTARTQIEIDPKDIDVIVKSISEIILDQEEEFVKEHRAKQTVDVASAIAKTPLLRSALRGKSLSEYVNGQQMNWKAENFVSDLALKRFRDQREWEREFEESLSEPAALAAKRDEILQHISDENRDALASYVAHRKTIIQLAEKTLELQGDGRMSPEDVFHDLVHPRYADSDNTKFYQHNLWMLDEKLSFFSHISSDRANSGGARKKGDKVGDLVFFDDCSIYRESDNDTVVLVEFKRPGRNDYRFGSAKTDPITQVIDTANKIREDGKIISTRQRTITVPKGVRIYCYVIADLESKLKSVCESHDMKKSWDGLGYHKYHQSKDMFIEVLGYDKLLTDAKKRNAAFFDVLLGDLVD